MSPHGSTWTPASRGFNQRSSSKSISPAVLSTINRSASGWIDAPESCPRIASDRATSRLLIVAGVAMLWTAAVFLRLGYLQLVRHGEYLARAHAATAAHD